MRLTMIAVGRMKPGPALDLTQDYLQRFSAQGKVLGFPGIDLREIDERKAPDQTAQSEQIRKARPAGSALCLLDERGRPETSPQFADRLARWRDAGRDVTFAIGGSDGHTADLRQDADHLVSFGPMVWPHMLVRVMFSEQLYRAATILAGAPYHRG